MEIYQSQQIDATEKEGVFEKFCVYILWNFKFISADLMTFKIILRIVCVISNTIKCNIWVVCFGDQMKFRYI